MQICLDPNKKAQFFDGFGASGAWWAQEVGNWNTPAAGTGKSARDEISALLFSPTEGIGLRTYRYNIGAGSADSGRGVYSDALRRTHSFETAPGAYDWGKDAAAVYMMKRAVQDGARDVILFFNSPPERLTKNSLAHTSPGRAFRTNLSPRQYAAFAAFGADVTEHFLAEGIPVRAVSPVNEPMWKWTGGQEGCHYSPRQAGLVMEAFAEAFDKRPALKDVRLSGVENGDIRWFNRSYTREMLRHEAVRRHTDGVDVHSYFAHIPLPLMNDRPAFLRRYRAYMERRYPDFPVRMSEWTHMVGGRDAGMDSALETARTIWEDLTLLNAESWQHWIAVSPYDYCDGLIYIDPEDRTFRRTKRWSVTGNFSLYIPYRAQRIAGWCLDREVQVTAFEKDGKATLVLTNPARTEKTVRLPDDFEFHTAILTDATHDLFSRDLNADRVLLPPRSVTTVI